MPLIKKPMRYAHPEGHTDVCYFTGEKGGLITCGSDGDVRSWLNLMDDDPAASCIAEQAISVTSKNGKIYVGNDNNTVQILTYPDLEKEGVVTRFSAPVSALATATESNVIVSGACDTRIQVTNISTCDSIELEGHEAPILGLSLDPKEEFVASSSADGSIRVWNIKERTVVNVWHNVVPKCNSFFTAKAYCVPSFQCKTGSYLAYPHNKDIVIVERSSWKEYSKLKCINIKTEISICKFSECGTKLAASTVYGEIIVWDFETKDLIGYTDHQQNAKITSIAWKIDNPDELAFCDAMGQLGCIDVIYNEKPEEANGFELNVNGETLDMQNDDEDSDDDAISLNKIKALVNLENDEKAYSDAETEKTQHETKVYAPEINLQPPFQPSSSPVHLLTRYMVWNDTGMVRCFASEDAEESSIEVEFHDVAIHRSIHISNYLGHKIAALSRQALALSCPASDDGQSKIVVIALQGWGSGNKEWTSNLPDGEEGECIAAGDNFVAVATSTRNLRIFTVGGTQREIIALPGPVVAMNALGHCLAVAYHSGVGASGDQQMMLMWIQIRGVSLRNQTLSLPLSPSSELMWLGLTDFGSPAIMDAADIIRVYNKKLAMWKVACDLNTQNKGKGDHYFITGISEKESMARCVLCKGSYYPPTTPRPIISEILLSPPLCDPGTEKTEKERKLWQLGTNASDEHEAVLALIALACRSNLEFRAVELCEQVASEKVIELAIRYARGMNRVALSTKLESIADAKDERKDDECEKENEEDSGPRTEKEEELDDDVEDEPILTLPVPTKPQVEIRPLSMNASLSMKRSNPFFKKGASPTTKGLAGLDVIPEKPQKLTPTSTIPTKSKPKESKDAPKKQTFIGWYAKNKKRFQEEFPHLSPTELTKTAVARYNKEFGPISKNFNLNQYQERLEAKKRKLSDSEDEHSNLLKRSTSEALSAFASSK